MRIGFRIVTESRSQSTRTTTRSSLCFKLCTQQFQHMFMERTFIISFARSRRCCLSAQDEDYLFLNECEEAGLAKGKQISIRGYLLLLLFPSTSSTDEKCLSERSLFGARERDSTTQPSLRCKKLDFFSRRRKTDKNERG